LPNTAGARQPVGIATVAAAADEAPLPQAARAPAAIRRTALHLPALTML
jgi:hypothetical protein